MSFGEKIKALRERRNLSQQELADGINRLCQTHLKRNTISNYERNKSFPDQDKLIALVNILDTSSDNLLGLNSKHPIHRSETPNLNRNTYLNSVEEFTENDDTIHHSLLNGFSPEVREIKYILAKQHNNYSKNYNNKAFLKALPSIALPILGSGVFRAFQLPKDLKSLSTNPTLKAGDIVVGEKIEPENCSMQSLFFIIIWKGKGLKVLRHTELIQLVDIPDILQIWNPKAIIVNNFK